MEKMLKMFKQVKVNIPFLNIVQQVPAYAKFLKDLCTQKWHTQVLKKVFLATSLSDVLPQFMPVKYKDLGCPTISCTIREKTINKCLIDLDAIVNLIPYSVYKQLGLGELKPTKVTLQFADRSIKKPVEEIKDMLIRVE